MAAPTNAEQELLELINRARANPAGEFDALIKDAATKTGATGDVTSALRYFKVDLDLFRSQLVGLAAAAPLAWNGALAQAAATHSQLMIDTDTQSHRLPGEGGLLERAAAAGYARARGIGENVYAYAKDAIYAHAGFYIDWGTTATGIQDPAGHRVNMLSQSYTELGISMLAETSSATSVGPYVITQDFGSRSGYLPQLVGVAFDDGDADRFYDAGEGLGGVTVTATGAAGSFATTSWASGGYQMELPAGSYTVTFSGGGLLAAMTRSVAIGAANVKLDVNADDIATLSGGQDRDWLLAGASGKVIDGAGGSDMVSFVDAPARVVVDLAAGSASVGDQHWTLRNIEEATGTQFGDQIGGSAGTNLLRGLGGADWLTGSGGGDTFDGGGGRDTVSYSAATAGVSTSLSAGGTAGQATGDRYTAVENLTGSSFADSLLGDGNANLIRSLGGVDRLYGGAGRDSLDGGASDDFLFGGLGNDYLTGGQGNDRVDGGSGYDYAVYSGARGDYVITTSGQTTFVEQAGADGRDQLIRVEVLVFSDGQVLL